MATADCSQRLPPEESEEVDAGSTSDDRNFVPGAVSASPFWWPRCGIGIASTATTAAATAPARHIEEEASGCGRLFPIARRMRSCRKGSAPALRCHGCRISGRQEFHGQGQGSHRAGGIPAITRGSAELGGLQFLWIFSRSGTGPDFILQLLQHSIHRHVQIQTDHFSFTATSVPRVHSCI